MDNERHALEATEQRACSRVDSQTPCYAIFKVESGAELAVLLCPSCGCPRFADYACDTCKKREYEKVLSRIASRTQDTDLLWWQKEARAALDA
ncbi:MAG: hypothetical protein OEV73_00200 [Desulfobulbaceae bacterium]|nr:hypothetical protein [Desulfobulbaceae bacterium]